MKPRTNRKEKHRDIDKDTVVAYHELIQGRIQDNLNGVSIGPGRIFFKIAIASAIFAFLCLVVGTLVVGLRHRHVYLVDWDAQFLGPFFVILGILFFGFSTFLCLLAKQRTNQYRADLAFRPIGDYGVAVVHKSKITAAEAKKSDLKSGTTPHNVRHPGRPGVNDGGNRGDYSKSRGYDNRGYNNDYNRDKGRHDRQDGDRGRRDPGRDHRDGRGQDPDRPRRPREDGDRPRRPREDGDRPPRREGDRPPRRPDDRGPPRRPDDRGRRPDDRDRERRRPPPPPGSEEEKRREAGRKRYEEEKRRRHNEDRKRAELRKEAEVASYSTEPRGRDERGVDVDETRTYQIQTTVKLSRDIQESNESDL